MWTGGSVHVTPQAAWTHNPSRVDRSLVVSGEVAWNGLAGDGVIFLILIVVSAELSVVAFDPISGTLPK